MADTGDVSLGTFLKYNNELVQVVEWQHRTPGNLRAFYQGKMRNLRNGKLVEKIFKSFVLSIPSCVNFSIFLGL